jgi:hypothetical protein
LRDAQVAVAIAAQSKRLLSAAAFHPLHPLFRGDASAHESVMRSAANTFHQGARQMICKCDSHAAAGVSQIVFCKCSIGLRMRFS